MFQLEIENNKAIAQQLVSNSRAFGFAEVSGEKLVLYLG